MKKLFIIKIGGNVIDDADALEKFIRQFAQSPGQKILVHGGGKIATELADKLGITQAMVNGRRITDAETLKIAAMVYAGLVNKQIVALLQAEGVNALGLSGADMNVIKANKRVHPGIDFGFVGDIENVNGDAVGKLLEEGITPVFCPITHDKNGQLLNTNADTIASALAVALSKKYEVQLNYCFEKKGVLKNVDDEDSLIETMTKAEYKKLVEQGAVSKGMIPKLDNSFEAIRKGVSSVVIGHADDISKMINENEKAGTELLA